MSSPLWSDEDEDERGVEKTDKESDDAATEDDETCGTAAADRGVGDGCARAIMDASTLPRDAAEARGRRGITDVVTADADSIEEEEEELGDRKDVEAEKEETSTAEDDAADKRAAAASNANSSPTSGSSACSSHFFKRESSSEENGSNGV